MKYYIYAIRDNVADNFTLPIFSRSDEEMVRNIAYNLNQSESIMTVNAVDYDLYRIGTFDDEDGSVVSMQHVLVVHLSTLIRKKEEKNA